jgi:hypothetical protein
LSRENKGREKKLRSPSQNKQIYSRKAIYIPVKKLLQSKNGLGEKLLLFRKDSKDGTKFHIHLPIVLSIGAALCLNV